MSEYRMKVGKVGQKLIDTYQKIEDKFTDTFLESDENIENGYTLKTGKIGETVVKGYQKIEDGVVGGYQTIEDSVVKGYKKIEDKFVDTLLEKVDQDETK